MSTIHDALKKVQDNMTPENTNATPASQNPQKPHNPFNAQPPSQEDVVQEAPERKPSSNKTQKIVGTIFIVIILAGLGTAIFMLTSPQYSFNKSLKKLKKNLPPKLTQQQQQTAPVVYSKDQILVQGIMAIGNKHVALINGEICEVGQTINDHQIIKISGKDITVKNLDGTQRTIEVSK